MIITPIPIPHNQPPPIFNNLMSSENNPPSPPPATGNRKPANSRIQPPEQPPLKCPRCDSANTKFCYYNNYSLSQPRHFCKTCRRYWTKGGALRNVPIGGACRRTKKVKPPNAVVSEFGPGFKFLSPATTTASANTAAVDFQLGGLSLPRLHPATAGVYTQFVAGGPAGAFGLDLSGLNYPNSSNQEGPNNISISSIESLSSINQEMHWKLQQQRLALIYGNPTDGVHHHHHQKQTENSPMIAMNLFQNNNNNNYGSTNEIENGGVNLNWGNLQQEFNGLQ